MALAITLGWNSAGPKGEAGTDTVLASRGMCAG